MVEENSPLYHSARHTLRIQMSRFGFFNIQSGKQRNPIKISRTLSRADVSLRYKLSVFMHDATCKALVLERLILVEHYLFIRAVEEEMWMCSKPQ